MPIDHPYGDLSSGAWLRGNLHTHSTRSDGKHELQEVIDRYATGGYDFLMMSDHDVYTSDEDYAALNQNGLILIAGNEITANGVHILHVHADRQVAPHENRQQVLDEINAGRGFSIVTHPNWHAEFNHCAHENLREWQDYTGLEIYNGVIGRLAGSPYATSHWDRLLNHGRRVWGYAHDDFHNADTGDLGHGWNMVYAADCSAEAVTVALRQGRFYASTGVVITSIEVEQNRIRLETENADRIVALRDTACRFAVIDSASAEIEVPDDATYVRFECWGRGEQFAWTQPFWPGANSATFGAE